MKKNPKSAIWIAIWGALLFIGAIINVIFGVISHMNQVPTLDGLQYTRDQAVFMSVVIAGCLLPSLFMSNYYSKKENNRPITIITVCLLAHHVICFIILIVQLVYL